MGFFSRKKCYKTPYHPALYTLFDDMASKPHLLIAGATGSGKSVLENGILFNLLHEGPGRHQLILIDPKKVELKRYAKLPQVLTYANTPETMIQALRLAERIVDNRFSEMERKNQLMYEGSDVYVVIDELSFFMTSQKREAFPILKKLGMVSRAARVHMIACTQTVKATVLPTELTCNFDSRCALRTSTAQQSRMIIDCNGCERLPDPTTEHRAQCYFRDGANLQLWNIPRYSDREFSELINWWTSRKCMA